MGMLIIDKAAEGKIILRAEQSRAEQSRAEQSRASVREWSLNRLTE